MPEPTRRAHVAKGRLRTCGGPSQGEGALPSQQRWLWSLTLHGPAQIAAFRLDETPLELVSLEPPRGRGGRMTKQPQREPDTPFPDQLHCRGPGGPGQPPPLPGPTSPCISGAMPVPTTRG